MAFPLAAATENPGIIRCPPVSGFSVASLSETWFSVVDAPADQGRRLKSPLIRSQRPRRMATFR